MAGVIVAAMRRGGLWPLTRIRAGFTGGVVLAVAVPLAVVAARGDGFPVLRPELSGGGAWLGTARHGLVTLIDGASEQVVGSVPVRGSGSPTNLAVVQSGSSAYVVNRAAGTVTRVDGGTYEPSAPVRFGPGGSNAQLNLFAGRDALYVVDGARRQVSVADPVSLHRRELRSMAAQPGPGQSVMDAAGRLWVVDGAGGGLTRLDEGGRVRSPEGDSRSRLVLVQGRPMLVDLSGSRLGRLDGRGRVRSWSCLEVRPGDEVQLLGSASSPRVFAAVRATGTLVASGVDRDDCSMSVPVGGSGDVFGPLVESGGFVFVPNLTTGRAVVVDVAAGTVARSTC